MTQVYVCNCCGSKLNAAKMDTGEIAVVCSKQKVYNHEKIKDYLVTGELSLKNSLIEI